MTSKCALVLGNVEAMHADNSRLIHDAATESVQTQKLRN